MKKGLELLETKIWLIEFELENEYNSPEKEEELRTQQNRLINLRHRIINRTKNK